MLMEVMQHGWGSRGAANTFLDQLTKWERRIQEYLGESLETFSDGMKIAVLPSHAPDSIGIVVRLAAQQMRSIEWYGRTCQSFFSLAESSTKMCGELSRTPTLQVRHRWTLTPLAKAGERDASCADVAAMQRKTASSIKVKCKVHSEEKQRNTTDKNSPAKFEGGCRHCGKKGQKWADCWKRLAEAKDKKVHAVDGAPSTATVAAVEDRREIDEECECWPDDDDSGTDTSEAWVLSLEDNNIPADAEFLPLDSAYEEHTFSWNFPEGGRDLGLSNVQLRNANGLSIPSGRKVMESYDVLGSGGRVVLHPQTPSVQSEVKRPLPSVGKFTKSSAEVKFGSKSPRIDLHTEVAPVEEDIGREQAPNPPPAPRPEETQGTRLARSP